MAAWFRRRGARSATPRLRPRDDVFETTRVELDDLTPPLMELLGRAAYTELTLFENLSRAVATAPSVAAKAAIGEAAQTTLAKHRALVMEIERAGGTAAGAMEPYVRAADDFERHLRGGDWFEVLMTCYLTGGFLDDFYAKLAAGLPPEHADRVAAVFRGPSGQALLAAELETCIDANPRLASRLAMWGRRVVGDTMLVARSALHFGANHDSDEARIEPVFSELIAAHTRRMDALGLTA